MSKKGTTELHVWDVGTTGRYYFIFCNRYEILCEFGCVQVGLDKWMLVVV